MFKWNYEKHLYTHTLIPIINRFASTNEPLITTINIADGPFLLITFKDISIQKVISTLRTFVRCMSGLNTLYISLKIKILRPLLKPRPRTTVKSTTPQKIP